MNRLQQETSPYLRQHADNPVDWFPWGAEALDKAKKENKLIFLSIGYSACHWCHVMAHESFEDSTTAKLMNCYFVNIKVDREERPDLDKIYQTSQSLLNQRSGGWPLSLFLTPDKQLPIYGGTYFPKEARYGMPSFKEILEGIYQHYQKNRDRMHELGEAIQSALHEIYKPSGLSDTATEPLVANAIHALHQMFDTTHGGFGKAPKFPEPSSSEFLLDSWARQLPAVAEHQQSFYIVLHTLRKMCKGGIYDQLGGGFCRYTVDQQWLIPHFEKMLYDNGQLLSLLARVWAITGEQMFKRKTIETCDWVIQDMQAPQGAFYSSLDADSEGEEGRYYYWDKDQVQNIVKENFAIVASHFGLDQPANFEGHWHLYEARSVEDTAQKLDLSTATVEQALTVAQQKLLEQRALRTMPGRDEKILTSWNALMIKGMAQVAYLLDKPEYEVQARRAANFLHQNLYHNARLHAVYKDGKARFNAYLDDYAFLADALLYLNQSRWVSADFNFAYQLSNALIDYFEDSENGGFYFTTHDHEQLAQRPRTLTDNEAPAGYSVAISVLLRVGTLLGEERMLKAAGRAILQAKSAIQHSPAGHASLLSAVMEYDALSEYLIIRGTEQACQQWLQMTARYYHPNRLCFAIPDTSDDLPEALRDKKVADDHSTIAYPCRGQVCDAPLTDIEDLENHLQQSTVKALLQ